MAISDDIKLHEAVILKATKMKRLLENEDFKDLILTGYLKDFLTINVRHLSNSVREQDIQVLNRKIDAIGLFDNFIYSIIQQGKQAEYELEEAKKHQEYLEQEESFN